MTAAPTPETASSATSAPTPTCSRKVERALRHAVAHHLGCNEPGVAVLGF